MNKIVVSDNIKIENMIYEIRGKQVMLDSDLAKLYSVETKRINEAVKNNIEKFPERYCFKLSDNESNNLLVEIFDQKIEKCVNDKIGLDTYIEYRECVKSKNYKTIIFKD